MTAREQYKNETGKPHIDHTMMVTPQYIEWLERRVESMEITSDWVAGFERGKDEGKKEIEAMRKPKNIDDVGCPFCGDYGFDLIGLKSHYENGDCDTYTATENLKRVCKL